VTWATFHTSWGDIHLGPANALEALRLLGGGAFLPVHWGIFNLAPHAWDEPAETPLRLAPRQGVHQLMPRLGEAVSRCRWRAWRPDGVRSAAGRVWRPRP